MKILRILIMLLLVSQSNTVVANDLSLSVGEARSKHILTEGLNDTHPYIHLQYGAYEYMYFINSYERVGQAISMKVYSKTLDNITIDLKAGLVYGYKKHMWYNEKKRDIYTPMYQGFMPMIVPTVTFNINETVKMKYQMLGDALTIGLELKIY